MARSSTKPAVTRKSAGPRSAQPIDILVGQRVAFHRKQLALSSQALASAIGVTQQQLNKYESGTDRLSVGRFFDIARELEVPISSFFEGAGDSEGLPTIQKQQRKLLRLLSRITDEQIMEALVIIVAAMEKTHRPQPDDTK